MQQSKLRNPNIDYSRGWFFVTTQVSYNKTVLGVIADGKCELNELGCCVAWRWRDLFNHRPELWCDEFVVMPNHFHAVIKINKNADSRTPHLSRAIQIFKSITTNDYLAMVKAGECPNIGRQLWQRNYYDHLISKWEELQAIRNYIRNNPARWESDRFGPVATYHVGNLDLLHRPCVAFVASEGGDEAPPPRKYLHNGDKAPPLRKKVQRPVISTFTSRQERAVLAKCLASGRAYIHVFPAGIPEPLPLAWKRACSANKALLLSPFPAGTKLNKQRAVWCNQYVLHQAQEVWCGTIRAGGTLETLLRLRHPHIGEGGASSPPSSRTGGASSPPKGPHDTSMPRI